MRRLLLAILLSGCGHQQARLRDEQNIDQLVAAHSEEIQDCWSAALKKNPHLPSGQLKVRAYQHIDGALHSAQLMTGFAASNEVMACVSSRVNSWKTAPPKTWGPVDLTFDFVNIRTTQSQKPAVATGLPSLKDD